MGKCVSKKRVHEVCESSWEQDVLDNNVMPTGKVTHSVIISNTDATLRAVAPASFKPDQKALRKIIAALRGETAALAESGIVLKSGTVTYTLGKIDKGKAIYSTNGQGGGCTAFKTRVCVLIVLYKTDPAAATRLASEVAEYMMVQGH